MTPTEAKLILEAYEIDRALIEEREYFEKHNPELLKAYEALKALADELLCPTCKGTGTKP